eukprot:6679742-Prymnesium_polylepis.1
MSFARSLPAAHQRPRVRATPCRSNGCVRPTARWAVAWPSMTRPTTLSGSSSRRQHRNERLAC